MNGNQLPIVENFKITKPDMHKIDCITDKLVRECHKKHFDAFEDRCVY